MKQKIFKEKYPIYTLNIQKDETTLKNVTEIISYFKKKIDNHPIVSYIGEFDHYSHTKSLPNGEIAQNIKDAKNIIFCFGVQLQKPEVLAVRPRSIGVCELENNYVISFLEAPMETANTTMEEWAKSVKNL